MRRAIKVLTATAAGINIDYFEADGETVRSEFIAVGSITGPIGMIDVPAPTIPAGSYPMPSPGDTEKHVVTIPTDKGTVEIDYRDVAGDVFNSTMSLYSAIQTGLGG